MSFGARALGCLLSFRAWSCAWLWFCSCSGAARAQLPGFVEPGTQVVVAPPPAIGSCIGGNCAKGRPAAAAVTAPKVRTERSLGRRARFAYAGALLGVASAGLLLGGSIAIAVVDDPHSERITRGLWLGELAVATPIVALSSWVARRDSGFNGYRGLRRLGWTGYSAAVADGVALWYFALHDERVPAAVTISAGAIACFALLPHAVDALVSARHARARSGTRFSGTLRGFRLLF